MSGGSAEGEKPPWEQPWATRRDCEPHRGELVRLLGFASLVLGALTLCTCVTAFLALPMGTAAWVMARKDLAMMRAGLMDPRGEWDTRQGGDWGRLGVILSLLLPVCFALLVRMFQVVRD